MLYQLPDQLGEPDGACMNYLRDSMLDLICSKDALRRCTNPTLSRKKDSARFGRRRLRSSPYVACSEVLIFYLEGMYKGSGIHAHPSQFRGPNEPANVND